MTKTREEVKRFIDSLKYTTDDKLIKDMADFLYAYGTRLESMAAGEMIQTAAEYLDSASDQVVEELDLV